MWSFSHIHPLAVLANESYCKHHHVGIARRKAWVSCAYTVCVFKYACVCFCVFTLFCCSHVQDTSYIYIYTPHNLALWYLALWYWAFGGDLPTKMTSLITVLPTFLQDSLSTGLVAHIPFGFHTSWPVTNFPRSNVKVSLPIGQNM